MRIAILETGRPAPQLAEAHGDYADMVARLFADGASHGEVAAKLGVRPATVRNQLTSIYRKLDIHSKAELARLFPTD